MQLKLSPTPRIMLCRFISFIALTFSFTIIALCQDAALLAPNQPVEKTLSGGETHSYRVAASAGQYFRITVEQRNLDVTIKITSPGAKSPVEIDLTRKGAVAETAAQIAEIAGDYRIEVSTAKTTPRGNYQILLADLRSPTEQDRQRSAAQKNFLDADTLYSENSPGSRRKAIEKYDEALQLWRTLGERSLQALALYNIGDTYRVLNDYPKSLDLLNQALQIRRELSQREEEATVLNSIGAAYSAIGEKEKALECYLQTLPIRRETKNLSGESITLQNIGVLYNDLGQYRKALDYYNQSLPLRRTTKDQRGEAVTLNAIGVTYLNLGEKRKGLKFFDQSLQLRRAVKDAAGEATTLTSIGIAYSDLGEQQKALDAYNQALPLRRDPRNRAITLSNIGRAYDLLGATQEALNYYNQALPIFRTAKDRRFEAITLNFIGLAYWSAGEYQQALNAYDQALVIRRELKDATGEAATLNNIGLAYNSLGDSQKALDAYNQALPLLRAAGDKQGEAKALNNVGFAYDALGDKQRALDNHQRALTLSREVGDRMREAKVRYGIARIESSRNNLRQSRSQIEQTIKIAESLRAKLTSPELRATYRASVQQYYDLYVDVLMRMGKRAPQGSLKTSLVAEALQVSERARARSLVELLTESNADIKQGVDAKLIERERELQEEINDKTTEQIRLLGSRAKESQIADITKEVERLNAELRDTQTEIRRTSPGYANLTQPQPLTAREIQRLLDTNTMLLEFSLGEERSYLWAVTATAIHSYTLPKRADIEAAAKHFYELLTARNQYVAKESNQQKQSRVASADAESPKAAADLSKLILSPAAPLLSNKRLIVVADGALQYVPFTALPVASRPLVSRHEIVSLPSASTLAVLRSESAQRPKAAKSVAVIADPVFESKDDRVKLVVIKANEESFKASTTKEPPAGEKLQAENTEPSRILLYKSAKDSGATGADFSIPRLPNTRREAETILSLSQNNGSKSALDFAANRAAVISEDLSQYRILHFATHGFLNSTNPELSGLVLSMVDEQGKPQNGYLLAPELYNLKLPATELVVLSACQTGLGKEIRGEGIVGLTRGFMYAGAPRVVVSLWNVNDRATADLMKSFYQAMLAKGLRPAAALRAAQTQLMQLKQWQAPYFWAAFSLQGEWR